MKRASLFVALLVLAGCGPEYDPAWLVTKPRILGARASVAGTMRAAPLPGESVTIDLVVVEPQTPMPLVSWTLTACLATIGSTGDAFCTGMPIGFDVQTTVGGGPPSITVAVPADAPMGSTILLLGAVCVGSDIDVDLMGGEARCTAGGGAMLVTARFPVGTNNTNPAFAGDAITLGGEPWGEPPVTAGCDELPQARIGDEARTIAVSLAMGGREALPEGGNETLVLSAFATARELEQQYAVLEDDQDAAATPLEIDFTPEEDDDVEIPDAGLIVRFFFVLRDQRGGTASTSRPLCLRR